MARNKLSVDDASRRIQAQMTNEERMKKADRVIWNNSTAAELDKEVFEPPPLPSPPLSPPPQNQ